MHCLLPQRISCNTLCPSLWVPTSSSGLCSGRLELLEWLCQTLPALNASAHPPHRAAAQSQWRAVSQRGAAERLQGVQRPPGHPLWTRIRYTNTLKEQFTQSLPPLPMEDQVKFCRPQFVTRASAREKRRSIPLNNYNRWGLILKRKKHLIKTKQIGSIQLIGHNPSPWKRY